MQTLPAAVRLPPYRSVLPRGPRSRQLGLDPVSAVAVDGLPPALGAMLDELDGAVAVDGLVARAVGRGARAEQAEALLRTLLGTGALVDATAAERVARRRAAATVLVSGDGAVPDGVTAGLTRAGVGTVRAARGRSAAADLVVLADPGGPSPGHVAALLADGVAHLPIRLRDGAGVVGPLVLPARSACLGCLELHRCARDPEWPLVAAALLARPGRADPACVAATVALGTAQALVAIDGGDGAGTGPPPALGATLELDVAAARLTRRPWPPRPDCPCGAARGTSHAGHPRPGGQSTA